MSQRSSQKNRNLLRFYYKRNSVPGLGHTDEQRMLKPNWNRWVISEIGKTRKLLLFLGQRNRERRWWAQELGSAFGSWNHRAPSGSSWTSPGDMATAREAAWRRKEEKDWLLSHCDLPLSFLCLSWAKPVGPVVPRGQTRGPEVSRRQEMELRANRPRVCTAVER